MGRVCGELRELKRRYDVPILLAGDVFDRWDSPPELIYWAMGHLPPMIAIPGQHDLPQHNYGEIHRSAFGVLCLMGEKGIRSPLPEVWDTSFGDFLLYSLPWGFPLKDLPKPKPSKNIKIAIIHEYAWIPECSYPDAPKENRVSKRRKELLQFDVVIFGDNHKGFCTVVSDGNKETTVLNCGTMMRRKIDEIDYRPQVGIIYSDGTVEPHYLDTSKDIITVPNTPDGEKRELDVEEFLSELEGLQDHPLDFSEAVKRYINDNKVDRETCEAILKAMETK
jgi:DNA repair exonuclease SbcCD nuclease subunit